MSKTSILSYIVLTLVIGYAFIYPAFGEISSLLEQKQKYVTTLETVGNIESKKNALQSKFDEIPPKTKADIETILPSSLNFVKLISQIDAVAANYGISVDKISVREVGSSVGNSIEEAGPIKDYQSSIVGFSFEASYDKFNTFVGELEKSLRILDVRLVKLNTAANGVYSYDVEFETYWLKQI